LRRVWRARMNFVIVHELFNQLLFRRVPRKLDEFVRRQPWEFH
jgi:hypothetical protein